MGSLFLFLVLFWFCFLLGVVEIVLLEGFLK